MSGLKAGKIPSVLVIVALVLSLTITLPAVVLADWSHDPSTNTPVVTANSTQGSHRIISDGECGFFAVWHDYRNEMTSGWDIYAQRFDAEGNPLWGTNGLPVCTADGTQLNPKICLDGSGGCVISWEDYSGSYVRIYVQRLNGNGAARWADNGIIASVSFPDDHQYCPWIISDGQGGAIVSWKGNKLGIYLQRLSSSGSRLWGNYVTVSDNNNAEGQKLIPDGQGGAIITWVEFGYYDIYIQRVDSSGNKLWGAGNVIVCDADGVQACPRIIPASDGSIVMWQDHREYATQHIFAQKISGTGVPQWTDNGVCVFSGYSGDYSHGIASDGADGAIITWSDTADNNTYARRIGSNGNLLWGAPTQITYTGDYLDTSSSPRKTVEDGEGGAITVWVNDSFDIYAQRIDGSGNTLWTDNGVLLCDAPEDRACPRLAACEQDNATGALAYWKDMRNDTTTGQDIYMQGVDANGNLARPCPALPSPPVGGEAYPVSRPAVLAPWIALAVAIAIGGFLFVRRRSARG